MATVTRRIDLHAPNELARRVRNFLHTQTHKDLKRLEVEVHNDVVFLRGPVCSPAAQKLASDCCSRVAGVRRVVNETTLESK
jgi:osmotically-inducible protein OsmY